MGIDSDILNSHGLSFRILAEINRELKSGGINFIDMQEGPAVFKPEPVGYGIEPGWTLNQDKYCKKQTEKARDKYEKAYQEFREYCEGKSDNNAKPH